MKDTIQYCFVFHYIPININELFIRFSNGQDVDFVIYCHFSKFKLNHDWLVIKAVMMVTHSK